jgi:hypothetical protein
MEIRPRRIEILVEILNDGKPRGRIRKERPDSTEPNPWGSNEEVKGDGIGNNGSD